MYILERSLGPLGFLLLTGVLLSGTGSLRAQPAPTIDEVRSELGSTIADTIEADPFAGAFWGIRIINLESGEQIYQRNVDHVFTPASNAKLLTAVAALRRLGRDYRYRTRLYTDGRVDNGVLRGNLIVRGSGDPTLGGYHQRHDPTHVFRQWADSLKAAGIRRIEGDIIGDDDPFSDVPLGEGWSWDDVPHDYAAEVNGLVFNVNTIDVTVTGRDVGAPGRITWSPFETDFVRMINQTRTIPRDSSDDEEYDRPFGTNTFRVSSLVHPRRSQDEALTVTHPTRYFTHVLREVLVREGLSVKGGGVDIDEMPIKPQYAPDSVRRIATYRSPPLDEVVRTMNHESQNLYAEQLLRTLAVVNPPDTTSEEFKRGSAALGAFAVKSELSEVGVDTSQVQMVDGSGLSRKNLISPRGMSRLLGTMWNDVGPQQSSAFYNSLPQGGEEGTLEYRFLDGAPARGTVRAKTGTLSNVSSLSGYVRTGEGTPLSFVIFCNHHLTDTDDVRDAQDAIVNALARLEM